MTRRVEKRYEVLLEELVKSSEEDWNEVVTKLLVDWSEKASIMEMLRVLIKAVGTKAEEKNPLMEDLKEYKKTKRVGEDFQPFYILAHQVEKVKFQSNPHTFSEWDVVEIKGKQCVVRDVSVMIHNPQLQMSEQRLKLQLITNNPNDYIEL